MKQIVQRGTEQAAGLQWVKAFMGAGDRIVPAPQGVDRHAVVELACRPYSHKRDLDAREVAHRAWGKHGGMSCDGALS